MNRTGEKILLMLWVGGHWMIGFLAVPMIRSVLAEPAFDEARASLLQQLFTMVNLLGLGTTVLMLMLTTLRLGWRHWRNLLIVAAFALCLFLQIWVYPTMYAAESGSDIFNQMHGTSMTVYLIIGVLGLALTVFEDKLRRIDTPNTHQSTQ